jgi:KaiC/GvpD/RAD55 family RecA-like ATPase
MAMTFQKATKKKAKLRLALVGPSGSGKTYTALAIATNLGARVAVIDTERGSASKYADLFSFDALDLESFAPQQYVDALDAAAKAGYDVVVVDSLSHAWMGAGGALEQVDNIAKKSQSRSSFNAWREVTPQHNAMVDAIIRCPLHVIVTMRAKTEYVLEKDDRGKTVPRKVGIQPVQRDGLEYEFDVVADVTEEHNFIVSKTRCSALADKVFSKPGKNIADALLSWLTDGAEAPAPLEKALAASVDAQWPKWVAAKQSEMREAAKTGRLLEVWSDIAAEMKKLTPPTEHRDAVVATKNELKATNGAAEAAAQ